VSEVRFSAKRDEVPFRHHIVDDGPASVVDAPEFEQFSVEQFRGPFAARQLYDLHGDGEGNFAGICR
jgi:hypothetical protein